MSNIIDPEIISELFESWGSVVPRNDVMHYSQDIFSSSISNIYTSVYDRSGGRYLPYYEMEMDLHRIRGFSWVIAATVPMAGAWRRRLVDYTISSGFDWTVAPEKDGNRAFAAAASKFVDRVLLCSDWPSGLERESMEREIEDGECILTIEEDNGDVCLFTNEGAELTEPANPHELERYYGVSGDWSLGVLSSDRGRPIAYHITRDDAGNDWDLFPARDVCHWKRNVRARAKRGLSDFFLPQAYLYQSHKVVTNAATGAAAIAAIAYIVEHSEGTSRRNAERMVASNFGTSGSSPRAVESNKTKTGAVRLDVPKGQTYKSGLLGSNASKIYIDVLESCLRLAGTVHAFPEGMLTGSYENNNMASALVAETPFLQGRLADQASRARHKKEMIEKIIRKGISLGVFAEFGYGVDDFDRDLHLDIQVVPSRIAPRDINKLTDALEKQIKLGLVSQRTAINELGRDFEAEEANGLIVEGSDKDLSGGGRIGQSGNWMGANRRDLLRYQKIVSEIEAGLASGDVSESGARVALRGVGVSDGDIDLLIQDSKDGKIDNPISAGEGQKEFQESDRSDRISIDRLNRIRAKVLRKLERDADSRKA